MQNQKKHIVVFFILLCVMINFAGKTFAQVWELPVWLDSFGTMLAAYVCGPFWGAIVGLVMNIISNFSEPLYMVYGLTSVLIGVITGIFARRKMLESLFGLLSTGFVLAMGSVLVSVPLNYLFFHGYTGNKWGDGVIDMLKEYGVNLWVSYIVGEYYVDFIDKVLNLLVLFALIHFARFLRGRRKKAAALLLAFAAAGMLSNTVVAEASGDRNYNDWMQSVYNMESGMVGGSTTDMAQTEDGVLWIGSYGGLYRYSGKEFQLMNQFESIKNVNCLYTDDAGRLWIGTNDCGLSVLDDGEIVYVLDESGGLPSDSVRCIGDGKNGNYYVGTTGSLAIVNLSGGMTVAETVPEITYAISISVNSEGTTAVVTDAGILYLLKGAQVLSQKVLDVQGDRFTCAVFMEDDRLYVGTSGNYFVSYAVRGGDLREKDCVECGDIAHINSLNPWGDGSVMVCAENGAGYTNPAGRFFKINTGAFNSSIDHMLFDYQGNLWFTSSRLGLLKLCETSFTEIYAKLGIPENVVNAITKWQGNFYFGTDGGLDMADGNLTDKQENFLTQELDGVRIRSFLVDDRDALWICTTSMGVWCVSAEGEVTIYDSSKGVLGDKSRLALQLRDKTVVLAGDLGLTFVKDGTVTRTIGSTDGLKNPKILCLLEREDGSLLAGTDGDGIAVIRDGRVVENFRKEEGLGSKVILRMVADGDGGIFIVTGNSLCYMDRNRSIRVLERFPYYDNYDVILGTDGMVFVTCSAGVYVVDKEELLSGYAPECRLLDYDMGLRLSLTANSWNYVDEENRLYLAGNTGVAVTDMEHYIMRRDSYRMHVLSVQADDAVNFVHMDETVRVPRESSRIVITPEIINYAPDNPDVSLYLEGFDTSPKVCPLNELKEAVYTNLPPGSYIFHLAVLDEKGEVLSESTNEILKETEIYDEKWFMFYVVLVAVLTIVYLTWLLFRTQIQKTLDIQKRELELARKQVEMGNEAILTIAKAVDAKDENTSQHSYRVSEYAGLIAGRLGFSQQECSELKKAALLHDIGKIGIPDNVLNKPAKLTDEEYAVMKGHVDKGAEILKEFTSVAHIVEGAQYHHERYDGRGYAKGLKGEEIPLYARIIGIADAFDAMTANRVYRKKMDFSYVLEELRGGRGTQFDPELVDILLSLIEDGTIEVSKLYEGSGSGQEEKNGENGNKTDTANKDRRN